jgi:hypothetical protein
MAWRSRHTKFNQGRETSGERRWTLRKVLFVGAVAIGSLGIAAAAVAYFTSHGTGTGSASVGSASVASITISPPTDTVVAGQAEPYTVTAHDNFGGSTDVSASANLTIQHGTCIGNSCTSMMVGSQTVTATYSSKTTTATQSVSQAATTTSVVSTTGSPSVTGQQVTYTGTVAVTAPGSGTPTGNIEFLDSGTAIGTCGGISGNALSGTTATCAVTYNAIGSHTITAKYLGDTNYSASPTSSSITQVVNQAATTTAVTGNATSVSGQSVTFTVTVTTNSPGSGNATGSVAFYETPNGGSATVITGCTARSLTGTSTDTTTCTTTSLIASGSQYSISATYAGDSNYSTSTATGVPQTVNKASPTVSSSVAGGPASGTVGTAFPASSINAAVSGLVNPDATGTISFYTIEQSGAPTSCSGGTIIGSAVAETTNITYHPSTSLTPASAGNYWVYAVYSGDSNNLTASGTCTATTAQEIIVASATPPTVTSISTANGGTAGKIDTFDVITITFSSAINTTTLCSGWNGSTQAGPSVSFSKNGGTSSHSELIFSTSTGCSTENFGTLDLGASWGSNDSPTYSSSINYLGTTLTITLTKTGGNFTPTDLSTVTLTYNPSTSVKGTNGINLSSTSKTSTSAVQF